MHPQDFVANRIAAGDVQPLIRILDAFSRQLDGKKTKEHAAAYNFANMFLVSVMAQLRQLEAKEISDDDPILITWRNLALFGIDRHAIPTASERDGLTSSGGACEDQCQ